MVTFPSTMPLKGDIHTDEVDVLLVKVPSSLYKPSL